MCLFKTLFDRIASEFEVKRPSILVKKWMVGIAWRVEGVLAFLFGKKQNITKETANSSMKKTLYSNKKIKSALDYDFISIEESVKHAVDYFKRNNP